MPGWCIDVVRHMRKLLALALLFLPAAAPQSPKSPLLVLLGGEAKMWQAVCQERGWQFLQPENDPARSTDQRVKAIAAAVEDAEKRLPVDTDRVYLAAQGGSVSMLFYVAARTPDLWAAAVAAGGSPGPPSIAIASSPPIPPISRFSGSSRQKRKSRWARSFNPPDSIWNGAN